MVVWTARGVSVGGHGPFLVVTGEEPELVL